MLGFLEIVVGGSALVERPDFVHDRLEPALRDEFEDSTQLVFCAHVRAQNGKVAREQKADVELGVVASGGAASDQAAPGGEALHTVVPGGCTDVLDNNVDAMIIGQAAHFFRDGHDAVMNHLIGANLFGLGNFFVAASGGDDASTEKSRNLDRCAADTAAGGENQDFLARLKLRAIDEHVPGSLKDERNSGGMGPIQILGIGHAIHFRAADIFGATAVNHIAEIGEIAAAVVIAGETRGTFPACDTRSKDNFLANVNGADFGSDFGDFSGNIAAGNMRQRNGNTGESAADPEVKMIEGTSVHADEHFVMAEMGFGNVGVMKNGRITVLMKDDGFHERPPRTGKVAREMPARTVLRRTLPLGRRSVQMARFHRCRRNSVSAALTHRGASCTINECEQKGG